jgi:S-adenosylmethionine-diacylgycerolhomoserine-N-methlytransferase
VTAPSAAIAMDRMYRRQRHVYDLTRKFYLLGRDRLIARLNADSGGSVLEVGCGTGRNLIEIGGRYRGAWLYGLDVSSEMLASANAAIARAGLSGRVTLRQADAATFDPMAVLGRASFDRIVISYCLSMIPEWQSVLEAAVNLLPPGGELHIVDFGRQERLPSWCRAALRFWLNLFHVTPRDDLEQAMAVLAHANGMTLLFERPYCGYSQIAALKRPR